MKVREIRIEDYQYDLPEEKTAKYPLAERDASKLLVFNHGAYLSDTYAQLARYIPAQALMLFNNTKVIPARLHLAKASGGMVEIFCLEPMGDPATEMARLGEAEWKCLVGGAKKWKEGLVKAGWNTGEEKHEISAEIIARGTGYFHIKFRWQPAGISFAEVLSAIGQVPLPPYLNRQAEKLDQERYQTIYAEPAGSVAAPTAGLHFTPAVFSTLRAKAIQLEYLTLHVGAGTFKPVSSSTIGDHEMHAEYLDVSASLVEKLQYSYQNALPVIAVGTTTLRTLESLYLMGCKLVKNPGASLEVLEIRQWDAYEIEPVTQARAFAALYSWMKSNQLDRIVCTTQLLIAPGYQVKTIKGLITNFHQPGSTLLLLVAALIGEEWKKMYQYALDNGFRFLSYGDGCYLEL